MSEASPIQRFLTPARLAWVLDAGHTTVEDWLKNGEIEHFRKGRLIRISPEAVFQFVASYTRRRDGGRIGLIGPIGNGRDLDWGRIERLIQLRVSESVSERVGERDISPSGIFLDANKLSGAAG